MQISRHTFWNTTCILITKVCYSNNNYQFVYSTYTYAEFSVEGYYFYALLKSNSLTKVDKSDIESFIHSLYSNSFYAINNYYDYYFKLYGIKKDVALAAKQAIIQFEEEFLKKGRTKTIVLNNKKIIKVEYFNITGLFLKIKVEEDKWSYSSYDISYTKYPEIDYLLIPVHIFIYEKPRKNHFPLLFWFYNT